MAKETGLSKSLISLIESDNCKNPTLTTLEKIAKYIGKDMSELIEIVRRSE